MLNTCSRAILLLCLTGCSMQPLPRNPRPPLPMPAHLQKSHALPGPVHEDFLVPLDLNISSEKGRIFRGQLTCGTEHAEFHLLLPEDQEPEAFLLCLPILAGGQGLMWYIAQDMAERGYAVAWIQRVASAMKPGQRGPEIETLLRRTIQHNRMVLAWARNQPWLKSNNPSLLGVSTGGLVGSVLMALEPSLEGGVICLAGGDLPSLVLHSGESRLIKWRHWRHQTDNLNDSEIHRELAREVVTEPARFGAYVASDRVLMVAATLDQVIPWQNQDLLWESLGRPRRLLLPLAHYTAALGIHPILNWADEFLRSRRVQRPELLSRP